MTSERSFFLELPTELRLHIYDYVLEDSNSITITSLRKTTATNSNSSSRPSTSNSTSSDSGLPANHVPVLRNRYDPELLSFTSPPSWEDYDRKRGNMHNDDAGDVLPAPFALLQTSRQVRDELCAHMGIRINKTTNKSSAGSDVGNNSNNGSGGNTSGGFHGLHLYVSYPYGVIALMQNHAALLHNIHYVHIAGAYETAHLKSCSQSSSFDSGYASSDSSASDSSSSSLRRLRTRRLAPRLSRRPSRLASPTRTAEDPYSHSFATVAAATSALTRLTRALLPSAPHPTFRQLSLRVYYAGERSYNALWDDSDAPSVVPLANACGGKVLLDVNRGVGATGMGVVIEPAPGARHLTVRWPKLPAGVKRAEGWVVEPAWGGVEKVGASRDSERRGRAGRR
ncbi:hypothetical protein BDY21DRAFT_368363 [Lineolata rhizophorae]|uniref:F-box domain-containing protein n=1 Tax=Lineolata rhizophorae TaxID=578093 RepID=A0A6A6PE85_9PEZI|nr:hypothetical protein BDY21DRAFT_368363 [Lineolata rhizophorae]